MVATTFILSAIFLFLLLGLNTPVFVPGYVAKANFTPSGGASTDINILDYDWLEEVMDLVTTHSGSGGISERIAGLLDGRGAVHANYDLANQFHKAPLAIVAGQKGILRLYVSVSQFIQIPVMIQGIPWKSAVAGKVEFSFNVLLSGDAGTYARPA